MTEMFPNDIGFFPLMMAATPIIFVTVVAVSTCMQVDLTAYLGGSSEPEPDPVRRAVCILNASGGSKVKGTVVFEQHITSSHRLTKITAQVSGLTPGKHGFHIHELGDLSDGCKSAKGHYNPHKTDHGGPNIENRHVGDLGNIVANKEGNATFELVDELVQLNGENSVLGRSVVVHAGEDDLGKGGFEDSLITGHAGARVACGVIGLSE
eukprot:2615_1